MNHHSFARVEIRGMTEDDADAVRHVERAAFGANWKAAETGLPERPLRTRKNVLVRLQKDPHGCFVAQSGTEIVGIVFSRTWGGVGWVGSLAVQPAWQGRGIGSQLLRASLGYLRADPSRAVGLETGAGEARSVGLYLHAGLVACPVTLHLTRELGETSAPSALPRWSSTGATVRSQWLHELREASASVIPGLDYSKEIESAARDALGDTCVAVSGGRAVGMGVVIVESPFEGWGHDTAVVQGLILDRCCVTDEGLGGLLTSVEAIAREGGRTRLRLVISVGRRWAVDRLLAGGYQVERIGLQMVHAEAAPLTIDPDGVDCSRWAG